MYDKSLELGDWVGLALKTGEINLRAMELLDAGNTGAYGHPVPTEVPLGHKKGKAILVSGHDLKDLEDLLQQTEGKGIDVYTHGEMLPTHGYPKLKKYPHFYGHYGTAWQNQRKEFAEFPGAILMTTNCLQNPQNYMDSLFTTGLVGWPGAVHVENGKFGRVIEKALEMPGFAEDEDKGTVWVGYGRNAILQDHPLGRVADTLLDYVGKARSGTSSWSAAATARSRAATTTPNSWRRRRPTPSSSRSPAASSASSTRTSAPSTACRDWWTSASATTPTRPSRSRVALAEAFGVGVNDLPLSMVLSWYEQKAVAILLTLLHLGIKDIRLGPTLPAFISPNVLNVLVENFDIKPITTPDEDLKAILAA